MVSVFLTATRKEDVSDGVIAETEENDRFVSFKDASGSVVARYRWADVLGYVITDGSEALGKLLHSESAPGAVISLTSSASLTLEHVSVEANDKWTVFYRSDRTEVARFRSSAIVGYRVEPESPLLGLYRRIQEAGGMKLEE